MAKRRKEKKTYKYECTLTGESFILTGKAANPDDLVSVPAYYEMNPDEDDRPQDIKIKAGTVTMSEAAPEETETEAGTEEESE